MFKSTVKKSNIITNPLKKFSNDNNNKQKPKTFLIEENKKKLNISKNTSNKQLLYTKSEIGFYSSKYNDDFTNMTNKSKINEQHNTKKEAFLQKLKDMIFSPGDINYSGKENELQNNNNIERNNILKSTMRTKSSDKFFDIRKNENGATNIYNKTTKFNLKNSNFNNLCNNIRGNLLPNKLDNRKTLVLDLDETLIHSAFEPFKPKDDIKLRMKLKNEQYDIHVLKRPYLDQFLDIVTQKYEVVVFTASISDYANPLLDQLDPFKRISHRLFREHCTKTDNGLFIKDLNKLGRNLKDVIIIDNNPISYTLNKMNGLPILTWHSIQSDNELIKLIPLLLYLTNVDDIRPIINKVVNGYYVNYKEVNKIITNSNNIISANNKEDDDYFNNWFVPKNKIKEKKEDNNNKNNKNYNHTNKEKEFLDEFNNKGNIVKRKESADQIIKYKGLLGSEHKFNFDNYKKAHNIKMFSGFFDNDNNANENNNLESNKKTLFMGIDNNNNNNKIDNSLFNFGQKLENKRANSSSNLVKVSKKLENLNNNQENNNKKIFNSKFLDNEITPIKNSIYKDNSSNNNSSNFNFDYLNNSKLNITDANISINKSSNYRNIIMNNNTNIINNNIYLINRSYMSNTNNNTIEHSSRNIYNNKKPTFKSGYQSANYFFNKKERAESAQYKQRQNNTSNNNKNNKNILSDLIDNLINYNRNNKKKNIESDQLISISNNNKIFNSDDIYNNKMNLLNNIRTGRELYDKYNSRNKEKINTEEENKHIINAFLNNKINISNISNINTIDDYKKIKNIYTSTNTGNNFENLIQKNKKGTFLYDNGNNIFKEKIKNDINNFRINNHYSNIRQNKTIKYLSPGSIYKLDL